MNREEQKQFISDLVSFTSREIEKDLPKIPEEWGAVQLRMWAARRFENQIWRNTLPSEKRNFENDLTVYNL